MSRNLITVVSVTALLCAAVSTPAARAALSIRGYDLNPSLYDRFDGTNGDFIGNSQDLSGVGMDGTHYATMVSPSFFLSANHYHPVTNTLLTFYPGPDNDPTTSAVTATIEGGQRIGSSDLWLGWLADPLPASIATYSVYEAIGPGFIGDEVWAIGKDSATVPTQDQRLGRNIIDGVGTPDQLLTGVAPTPEYVAIFSYETAAESLVGGDECRYNIGDSGGPTFALTNGTFTLFGINYFTYGPSTSLTARPEIHDPTLEGSGVTLVPGYIDAINAAMAAQDTAGRQERLTVVPEPGTGILLALLGIGLAAGRRSRWVIGALHAQQSA